MTRGTVAAVDLGATSGRVILGHVGHNELRLTPVSRFPNGPVTGADGLHWDLTGLWASIRSGLTEAARVEPDLASIGVDSWAVDYARMAGGRMLAEPFHYRDSRTAAGVDAVEAVVPREALYAQGGLQFLPFNTLYQLAEDNASGRLEGVESILLIPDLIDSLLRGSDTTGTVFAERTNASTTGLIDVATGEWNESLIARLGLPRTIFPDLVSAGRTIGTVSAELDLPESLKVITVGSHDTASAVVAIPATDPDFAYISCGTWGLVGVELEAPLISDAGRAANFTNEGGVDGRVRYLHNVMGLWLLSETVRAWEAGGETIDLVALLSSAAAVSTSVTLFDVNDDSFLAPGDMPARIAEWCTSHGVAIPQGRAETVRSIIESLAVAFADAVQTASALSGKRVAVIHIVGGGSQNTLLCQLTADRAGLPVVAGPVEATAIGNVLIQARALGLVEGDLETLRALVASTTVPVTYTPRS